MQDLVSFEVAARKALNARLPHENMRLVSCGYYYDTVKLFSGIELSLGTFEWVAPRKYSPWRATKRICGWDVLSQRY